MAGSSGSERVRAENRRAVFRALAERFDPTRAELAHATGLSLPTVATILAELAHVGVVEEAGTEAGTGGRPAQRLRFVAGARHVVAVDLSGRTARALRVDLRGAIAEPFEGGPVLRPGVLEELVRWLAPIVRDPRRPPVRRVAVAVPGVVDPSDGHVDFAPALGWHDQAVAEAVETALGVAVTLENDVNALAVAESRYGASAGRRHVLFVALGTGVGAGLVIDGRLHRGAHAAAGEIGYGLPSLAAARDATSAGGWDGTRRDHGAPGALERHLLAIAGRCLDDAGRLRIRRPGAAAALGEVADALRPVLHTLTCLLDPELVVVSWRADPDGLLVARLSEGWSVPWPVPLVAGALGRDGVALGVARLALDRLEDDLCRTRGDGTRPAPRSAGRAAEDGAVARA